MRINDILLYFYSPISLCSGAGSFNKSSKNTPTNSPLPSTNNSSSKDEDSSLKELGLSYLESSTNNEYSKRHETVSKTTASKSVRKHGEFDMSYVEPTKSTQGQMLHTCTSCGDTYQSNFIGVLGRKVCENDEQLNVLFIGNSYTFYNNSWDIFKKICLAEGKKVNVDQVTCGGYTLEQMNDPTNLYGSKVLNKLNSKKFDIVFLQEQSLRPAIGDEALFYDAVRGLTQKIRSNGAIPVLYETWGRKEGSADLTKYNLTNESMTQKLIAAYGAIADELDLFVSHVGTAFYDLNVNNPELEIYDLDASHPSSFGSYLVALIHYATIFGESPIGVEHTYFTDIYKQSIAENAAHKAVFGNSILKDEYKTSSEGVTKSGSN